MGEVSIQRLHLVTEAQGNTLDHVLNMTADNPCRSQFLYFLTICQPTVSFFLYKEMQIRIAMTLVPLEGSFGALHNNCTSRSSSLNISWNVGV